MKKILKFAAIAALVVPMFTACDGLSSKVSVSNEIDSINYAFGAANGYAIKQYLVREDTTDVSLNELVDGFSKGYRQHSEEELMMQEVKSAVADFAKTISEEFLFNDSSLPVKKDLILDKFKEVLANDSQEVDLNVVSKYLYDQIQSRGAKRTDAQIDSINNYLAVMYGVGIRKNVLKENTDEKTIEKVISCLDEEMNKTSEDGASWYNKGLDIGSGMYQQLSKDNGIAGDTTVAVNFELVKVALIQAIKGSEDCLMTNEEASEYFRSSMENRKKARDMDRFKDNVEAGKKYMEENAKKEGVKTTESGIQYEIIKEGKGQKPTIESRVKVHYVGTLIDGTEFDSSIKRGEPAVFGVTQVIKGWTEILQLMPVGSKYRVVIPSELAYGERNMGAIKPFSTLIFEIELLGIED